MRASQLTCAHRPRLHGAGRLQFWGPRRAVLLCTQPRRRMPVQALYLCHWSGRAILQGCATTDSARGGTNTSKEVGIPPACTCRAAELAAPAISGLPHESFLARAQRSTHACSSNARPGAYRPVQKSALHMRCTVRSWQCQRLAPLSRLGRPPPSQPLSPSCKKGSHSRFSWRDWGRKTEKNDINGRLNGHGCLFSTPACGSKAPSVAAHWK